MARKISWFLFAVVGCLASVIADEVVRYSGTLTQRQGNADIILRNFEALQIRRDAGNFFCVLDDVKDGCPWPESFGTLGRNGGPVPHLVYLFDRNQYLIPLPLLQVDLPDVGEPGDSWTAGDQTLTISDQPIEDARGTTVDVQGQRGRRQTLDVDENGQVTSAKADVFMGQGERFSLQIVRSTVDEISAGDADQIENVIGQLNSLQAALKRRPDSTQRQLSTRQIQLAVAALDELTQAAKNTPLQDTVLQIRRDVEQQQRRLAESMKRQEELVGSEAPQFSLSLISGGTLSSNEVSGKTLILHFWRYTDKPLSEPYGQVGYLEHLQTQLGGDRVRVVGISTSSSLQDSATQRAARRSARKLAEFMNLSYPIGFDNGSLLRSLGDPREGGGQLPLWVVVSADGKVIHRHAGFYEVDRRSGLRELREIVGGQ